MSNKFGIYIHIPFCTTICPFCNFNVYSSNSADYDGLVGLLLSDLKSKYVLFLNKDLESIHFGGGTPSLLPTKLIEKILYEIGTLFSVKSDCEVTIEINPYDKEVGEPSTLHDIGINRFSIGLQSFSDKKLKVLGRDSTKESNLAFVSKISKSAIENFSFDFIFGVDKESLEDWEKELSYLKDLDVKHVSTYCLTIEESTPFWKMRDRGYIDEVKDDVFLGMTNLTRIFLEGIGVQQYEISNFSKPSYESKHNMLYWNSESYLGLGPGAHSSLVDLEKGEYSRWSNPKLIKHYRDSLGKSFVSNVLEIKEYIRDSFMMGLRLKKGVNLERLRSIKDFKINEVYLKELECKKLICYDSRSLCLTNSGFNVSNKLIFELIQSLEFMSD